MTTWEKSQQLEGALWAQPPPPLTRSPHVYEKCYKMPPSSGACDDEETILPLQHPSDIKQILNHQSCLKHFDFLATSPTWRPQMDKWNGATARGTQSMRLLKIVHHKNPTRDLTQCRRLLITSIRLAKHFERNKYGSAGRQSENKHEPSHSNSNVSPSSGGNCAWARGGQRVDKQTRSKSVPTPGGKKLTGSTSIQDK